MRGRHEQLQMHGLAQSEQQENTQSNAIFECKTKKMQGSEDIVERVEALYLTQQIFAFPSRVRSEPCSVEPRPVEPRLGRLGRGDVHLLSPLLACADLLGGSKSLPSLLEHEGVHDVQG